MLWRIVLRGLWEIFDYDDRKQSDGEKRRLEFGNRAYNYFIGDNISMQRVYFEIGVDRREGLLPSEVHSSWLEQLKKEGLKIDENFRLELVRPVSSDETVR